MGRKKAPSKEELDAMLFEEDEEDSLPRALDKNLLLLRQIDRINRIAASGDIFSYINSVEQMLYMLTPYIDKKYILAMLEEKKNFKIALDRIDPEDTAKHTQLNIKYYGQQFNLLMQLLSRRGMW